MEKMVTAFYIAVLLAGAVFVTATALFVRADIRDRGTQIRMAQHWEDHMERFQEEKSVVYWTVLPAEGTGGKVFGGYSVHMQVEMTIDGERVYSLSPDNGHLTKTTGYCWNFVFLTEEDAGKELTIRFTPLYTSGNAKEAFYYGEMNAVEHLIVRERFIRLVIAAIILLAGLISLFYVVFVVKRVWENNSLLHFALFAVILGIWYVCESQILELFLPWNVSIAFADHIALMLVPLPFLLFIRQMYYAKDHWIWRALCYMNCAVIVVRLVLQALTILDVRETLWMTHVGFGFSIMMVLAFSIYEIVARKLSGYAKLNIFCVVVIIVFVMLELMEFRIVNKRIPFGSFGVMFYIIVMGIVTLRDSRRMMEQARESELYRKLAFADELTGLYNRAAFNRDLAVRRVPDEDRTVYKILPTVIFMFDLNDLKKCNDGFGHEYGDRYIKMVSDTIRQVFGTEGSCYRIGGDEFCSIMDYTSQQDIERCCREFQEEIRKKDEQDFVVPVSVAVGYAVYDADQDASLEETMKRADAMMYEKKQEIKRARQAFH